MNDEKIISTNYSMVSSIVGNVARTCTTITRTTTYRTQANRDERVSLDTTCPETICQTVYEDGIPRMELV